LIGKVKRHKTRWIERIGGLRLLLYHIIASTTSKIKEMLVVSAAVTHLWYRGSRIVNLLQLGCLLNNQDVNHFIFVYEALRDTCVRVNLGDLLESVGHVVFLKFKKFLIFDFLEHAIKTIFNAIFCTAGKIFDNLRPTISNLFS
jgi:hypothetical protein